MFSHGILTVSLDFELFWGVRDTLKLSDYGSAIAAVHTVVPRLLDLFSKYEIHASWATVGFLYLSGMEEFYRQEPAYLPTYDDDWLNPYLYVRILPKEQIDPSLHFAPQLIGAIASTPHQELATHTFSHYYCLERGQTLQQFRSDLQTAVEVAERHTGCRPASLVFPRNQFNRNYLQVCSELGIRAYRGNQASFVYEPGNREENTMLRRTLRFLDSYVNLTGHHGYTLEDLHKRACRAPFDVPASMILRPWSRKFRLLEPLKVHRIKSDLVKCAKHNRLYHLWWHPHNFGSDPDENFRQLEDILDCFSGLRHQYGCRSLNMTEVADLLAAERSI